jgi:hypothetical protein
MSDKSVWVPPTYVVSAKQPNVSMGASNKLGAKDPTHVFRTEFGFDPTEKFPSRANGSDGIIGFS